jgi:signal transduction histidine kinase
LSRDAVFPRLVSLACHDLRTPLATVSGFAHTLERLDDLAPPADRYVRMMLDAAGEMAELLDLLGLLARIEAGRYEPTPVEADTLELANSVAARLGGERVEVTGDGGAVLIDLKAADRAVYGLVRCALRHGGLDRVAVEAAGTQVTVTPITEAAAPIVTGKDMRDLGAAVGMRVVSALGGSAELKEDSLVVRLPAAG